MQKKLSPWCKKAKIAMIQNDISVNDLAEELGCSRCYLSSTLNGKNTSIEIRRRISDYLMGIPEGTLPTGWWIGFQVTDADVWESMGADEDMQYIGDPNAFLLAYATNAPSVDEPSAGYIFTWDMLGNGQMLPILNYLGENGTHTEYIEGLMATDMKKTSDDLARFYKAAV